MRVNVEGTRNVLRLRRGLPRPAPPPLRQHLLRQRPALRALQRVRPRHGPVVQQLLRGDQVPRRGRGRRGPGRRACPRRCTAPRSSSATRAPATRRSSTGRTSCCSGCCASPGSALVPLVGDPTMVRFNMVPSRLRDRRHRRTCRGPTTGRPHLPARRPPPAHRRRAARRDVPGHRPARHPGPPPPPADHLVARTIGPLEPVRSASPPARSTTSPTPPTTTRPTTDRRLAGSGVACPPVADYLPNLVRFMTAPPEANVGVMV